MIVVYLILNLGLPLALAAGAAVAARRSARLGMAVAVACLALLAARPILIHQPCLEHRLFPWPDYVLVHGWHFFLFPALVIAVRGRLSRLRTRRALLLLAALPYVLHAVGVVRVARGPDVTLDTRRTADGFALQSAPYSCAAASSANLLRLHGIPATETEMARASLLARGRGVHDLGALRALAVSCRGSDRRPVLRRLTLPQLIEHGGPALVPLHRGFMVNHMVCVLEARPDRIVILDPAEGRVTRSPAEFARSYLGRAIVLAGRTPSRP